MAFSHNCLRFFCGIGIMGAIWCFNSQRQHISWKKVGTLLLSQWALMLLCLKFSLMQKGFHGIGAGIHALQEAVRQGTSFVFGYVGGGEIPFVLSPASTGLAPIFMFQILPLVVVMGALSMLLFHLGILPWIVRHLSAAAKPVWHVGGALSTAMVAKLFWGQTDTPLFIKPYLDTLTRNELFSLLCAGMATASATLFALYVALLQPYLGSHTALVHVLTAALINIPSALLVAELWMPENQPISQGNLHQPYTFVNSMHALATGALEGWSMIWSIGAMMIVSLALVSLCSHVTASISKIFFNTPVSLESLLGYAFAPFAWIIGVKKESIGTLGVVLAEKTLLNEVVALANLAKRTKSGLVIDPHSLCVAVYSLCNFANVSSIAMQVAGIGALAPKRQKDVATLAVRSLIGAMVAGMMSSFWVSFVL